MLILQVYLLLFVALVSADKNVCKNCRRN